MSEPPTSNSAATTLTNTPPGEIKDLFVEYFSDASVTASVLASLTVEQLAEITAAQTAVLVAAQLTELTELQVKSLSNVSSLTVPVNGAFPLTSIQVGFLKTEQLTALTQTQLQSFDQTRILALVLKITSLTKVQIGHFNVTQIPFFSVDQIQALTVGAASSNEQIQGLTSGQIAALTYASTANQVAALTAAQIHVLSATQIGAFTANQIPSLSVKDLYPTLVEGASGHIAQLTLLTLAQIQALSSSQVKSLTNEQVPVLTTVQIASFTPVQIPYFDALQVKMFTQVQIQALTITPGYEQIQALTYGAGQTVNQIAAFTTTQIPFILPTQLAAMSKDQVNQFIVAQISLFSQLQTAVFTKLQLSTIPITGGGIDKINAFKINFFNSTASLPFSADQLSVVLPQSIKDMQADHFYKLTTAHIEQMTPLQFAGLTTTLMKNWADANVAVIKEIQVLAFAKKLNTLGTELIDLEVTDTCLLTSLFVGQFPLFNDAAKTAIRNNAVLTPSLVPAQQSAIDSTTTFVTIYDKSSVRSINSATHLTYLKTSQMAFLVRSQIIMIKALVGYESMICRDALAELNANILGMSITDIPGLNITSVYPQTFQLDQLLPSDVTLQSLGEAFTAIQLNKFSSPQFIAFNSKLISFTAIPNLDECLDFMSQPMLFNMTDAQVQMFKPYGLKKMKGLFGNMNYDTAKKFTTYQRAGVKNSSTPIAWAAASDWDNYTPPGKQPMSWFTEIIIAYLQQIMDTNAQLIIELAQLNSTAASLALDTLGTNNLTGYVGKLVFEIIQSDIQKTVTYKKSTDGVVKLFTQKDNFKLKGTKLSAQKKSWGFFDVDDSRVLNNDGSTSVEVCKYYIQEQVFLNTGVKTVELVNNAQSIMTQLNASINTAVRNTLQTHLGDFDSITGIKDNLSQEGTTGSYYSPFGGNTLTDDYLLTVAQTMYSQIATQLKTRLDNNTLVTGTTDMYPLPLVAGDLLRFLLTISHPGGTIISTPLTFLIEIKVVA